MVKHIMSSSLYQRALIGFLACIVGLVLGFLILEISKMEDPPLGNTVYILFGSAFVFSSALGFLLIIKYVYDYKKKKERRERRRQKHKVFYLKDQNKEKTS